MQSLRHGDDEMSPTRRIYWILKPYRKENAIDDQHWSYVIECLRRIETRCNDCRRKSEAERRTECIECIERKMIEAI